MTQAQKITLIMGGNKPGDQSTFHPVKTISISKDQWLGECLDDCLFKLCGTDQVVWIPKDMLQSSPHDNHAFEVSISHDGMYCCAKLTISNSIRMCLVDQHQVKGIQLIPYLMES